VAGFFVPSEPASAPLVATLVDVTGLVIYFTVALAILRGTLL
jgi:magnesium transporter